MAFEGTGRVPRLLDKQDCSCGSARTGGLPDPGDVLGHSSSRTFSERAGRWKAASPAHSRVCKPRTVLARSSLLSVVSI